MTYGWSHCSAPTIPVRHCCVLISRRMMVIELTALQTLRKKKRNIFSLLNFKVVTWPLFSAAFQFKAKPYGVEAETDNTLVFFDIQTPLRVCVVYIYIDIYRYVYDLFSAPEMVDYYPCGTKTKRRAGPECLVKHYVKTLTRK